MTCATDASSNVICARSNSQIEDHATASSQPPSIYECATAAIRQTAADHPTRSSTEEPIPRAAISSLLHNFHGASPTGVGRPTFFARSTDDYNSAYRRGLLLPAPSPTARSAVFQPAGMASHSTAATACALGVAVTRKRRA